MLRLEGENFLPAADFGLEIPSELWQDAATLSQTRPEGIVHGLHYLRRGPLLALRDWKRERRVLQYTALFLDGAQLLALGLSYLLGWRLCRWVLAPLRERTKRQAEFAAGIAHELKTPLAVILANAGLLLDDEEMRERGRRQVLFIRDEGERMTRLVGELLALARLEAEEHSAGQRLDFSELLWGVLLSFEAVAFERGIVVEGEIAPGLFLAGDRDRLTQLVEILLDNACKFAPSGTTVRLVLRTKGNRLQMQVKNQGEPIPPEHLAHLFERFYQAPAREKEGVGLGLFLARRITVHHGGTLTVKSSGEGTVFTAELPGGF